MTSTTKYLALSILPLAALALVACGDDSDAEPSPAPTVAKASVNCGYEDMLAFELIEPAFDLPAGYVVCIHIDQARDTGVDN